MGGYLESNPYSVVLNFYFERLHHIIISHDKLIRHAQTGGVDDLSFSEHIEQSTSVTKIMTKEIFQNQCESKNL